jgi:hypothetical protein
MTIYLFNPRFLSATTETVVRLTQVELKPENIFAGVERLAIGEADDESEWLATTQDGRLGLSVHEFITNSSMLGGVVLGIKVDFVYGKDAFTRLWYRQD